MIHNEKTSKINKIFIVGLLIILAYEFWTIFYGLGNKDEAFYYSPIFRMMKGEILFTDIWSFINQQSFFIYPLVKLAMIIMGGKEGIIICLRIMYVLVKLLSAIFIYHRLKDLSPAVCIVVWMYLLFVPGYHPDLSYNSVSFMCGVVGVVLLYTLKGNKDVFICGILFGLSVLCQPLLFVEMIPIVIFILVRKKEIKKVIMFLIGGSLIGIPVSLYILLKIGIPNFIKSISWNLELLSDNHTTSGVVHTFKYMTWALFPPIKLFNKIDNILIAAVILSLIVVCFAVIIVLFIKRKSVKPIHATVLIVLCLIYSVDCAIAYSQLTVTVCMVPWLLVGIVLYLMSSNKNVKRLFKLTLAWTIIYGISFMTSNGGMKSFGIAIFPTVLISMLLFYDVYIKGLNKKSVFIASVSISIICLMVIGAAFPLRTIGNAGTVKMGAYKYISDSKRIVDDYNGSYEDALYINKKKVPTLIITNVSTMFLAYDNECVQYTTLFDEINKNSVGRLKKYYKARPLKKPKGLYIREEDLVGITKQEICKMFGFDINKSVKLKEGIFIEK